MSDKQSGRQMQIIMNRGIRYGIIRAVAEKLLIMRRQTEENCRDSGRDIFFWKRVSMRSF